MDICFVFNFHCHKYLNQYSFFDIGKNRQYFDSKLSDTTNLKNLTDYQLPLLEAIEHLTTKTNLKCSLFFSGVFLEVLSQHHPEMTRRIGKLVDSGKIELLGGTYYNSLACLYSHDAFKLDIKKHAKALKSIFNYKANCFTNSENIYSNDIGRQIKSAGFKSTIAPAVEWYLGSNNCHQIFQSDGARKLSLLLADCSISKFLFDSSRSSTFFMDDSLKNKLVVVQADPLHLPKNMPWNKILSGIKTRKNQLLSIEEAVKIHQTKTTYHIPHPLALNCSGLDLSYFIENPIQKDIFDKLKSLKNELPSKIDSKLQADQLALSDSRNFLNLSTKAISKETTKPHDHYLNMMNMLTDIEIRVS